MITSNSSFMFVLLSPRFDWRYTDTRGQHIITLWLVGVSYWINLTQVGIAIFVSMSVLTLCRLSKSSADASKV